MQAVQAAGIAVGGDAAGSGGALSSALAWHTAVSPPGRKRDVVLATVFEVLLRDRLHDGMVALVDAVLQRAPSFVAGGVWREVVLIAAYASAQESSLRSYDATLEETALGLRRCEYDGERPALVAARRRLSASQRAASLAFALVSFLLSRGLRYGSDSASSDRTRPSSRSQWEQTVENVRRGAQTVLPWLQAVFVATRAAMIVGLGSEAQPHADPSLWASRLVLARAAQVEAAVGDSASDSSAPPPIWDAILHRCAQITRWALFALSIVAVGQAMYASSTALSSSTSPTSRLLLRPEDPLPPPPPRIPVPAHKHPGPGLCPICAHPPLEPSAASTGFVFCRACLASAAEGNGGRCPVTDAPLRRFSGPNTWGILLAE
jgi:Pex2 / Pex12 amino terminal region